MIDEEIVNVRTYDGSVTLRAAAPKDVDMPELTASLQALAHVVEKAVHRIVGDIAADDDMSTQNRYSRFWRYEDSATFCAWLFDVTSQVHLATYDTVDEIANREADTETGSNTPSQVFCELIPRNLTTPH